MKLVFHGKDVELDGKYLSGDMRCANDILHDREALRERMFEDGFLLIRNLFSREEIMRARRSMLQQFADAGALDPAAPMMDAVVNPDKARWNINANLAANPELIRAVESPSVMGFFDHFLGGPTRTFDFKWMRAVSPGGSTGCHYDIVYMGRGTQNLFTCWTPYGDTTYDMGTLAILKGSHRFEKIKQTYGQSDVDRDHTAGWFSNDPLEVMDKFGGQWVTTQFQAGDALIFSMYTMHASLTNCSNKFRLSSDTRYQLASEPADERWIGEKPKGHYGWYSTGKVESIEDGRKRWGV